MDKIIIILILFFNQSLHSQIAFQEKLYPGVRVIKTVQFNGSGGGGYWNQKYLDQKGRVVVEEKYKKKKLLAVYAHSYDEFNNKTLSATVFSINQVSGENEFRTSKFSYLYEHGKAIEKQSTIGNWNSTKRIERQIDSTTFEIVEISQSNYFNEERINTTIKILELNSKGKVVKVIENQYGNNGTRTTYYQYFENGELKRRIIERDPEPELKGTFVSSPGSDDMSWEYDYDKKGRIKKSYSIVDGKKYKLEKYKYIEW